MRRKGSNPPPPKGAVRPPPPPNPPAVGHEMYLHIQEIEMTQEAKEHSSALPIESGAHQWVIDNEMKPRNSEYHCYKCSCGLGYEGPEAPNLIEPGQGSRDNGDKPVISMVMEAPNAIEGIAKVLMFGAEKYDRANWKRGLKYTEIIDSMQRHILKIMDGEDLDEESGLHHAFHIGCNSLFLAEMMATRPDMDDRPMSSESTYPHRETTTEVPITSSTFPGGKLK